MDKFKAVSDAVKGKSMILAIDGKCASGKTTLAHYISENCECTVFHMDDFFLRPFQRTPERLSEAGGNVDRERFLSEVLIPLKNRQPVSLRRFDCKTMSLCGAVEIVPKDLVIVEGTYSMHPDLQGFYDLAVFMDISPEKQKERILKRNPHNAQTFFDQWIPMENKYFQTFGIKEKCEIIIQ